MENRRGTETPSGARIVAHCFVFTSCNRSNTRRARQVYFVNTILACGNCHTPKAPDGRPISEKELSGGLTFTTPAFNAVAANITPDRETGIGTWSDSDIKRALTEGLRPSHARLPGVPLAAVMPVSFYKALRPDDLDAIVAYLRSMKPGIEVAGPDYKMPVQHQSYPDAEKVYSADALKDPVKRGAYLATIGHCMECHSAWKRGASDYEEGFGKGGRQFGPSLVQGVQAGWKGSHCSQYCPTHRSKGIGAWTDTEIKRAITQGISRDGGKLGPPMAFAWYANLRDDDLNAIVAWLRTVPPQE